MIIPIVLSLALVAALAYLATRRPRKGLPRAPGPLALPLIGASYLMDSGRSPFVKFTELAEAYGDVYSITLGSSKCVVVSSVKQIRSVLMQNGKFFGGRPDFIRYNKLFGDDRQNSLALCDWCNLQIRRRNIARRHCDPKPYSNINKLISEVGSLEMNEFVQTIKAQSIEANANGVDLNIKPIIMATCLNIFSQYMCSIRFDTQDAEFQKVTKLFDNIFWEINQGYAVDFLPWLLPFYSSHMKKLADWSHYIRNFILTRIINNREVNLDDDETEKDFTDALLKTLKHDSGTFTRDAILFTLEDFLGGSSAVGNTIMLMLGLIVKHPEVAVKIRDEIDNLTGGERPVTVADSEYLPYTTATVKETLRYQSSPIVPHVATEDASIDGYGVEKGTVIIINNYKINMDEGLWSEPTKFDPERFLDRVYVDVKSERRGSDHDSGVESENEECSKLNRLENSQTEITQDAKTPKSEIVTLKKNLTHFMPFSIGKRTCLGQGLLMRYSLVSLATILQNFDVSCKNPESIKTYTACIALPPDTFGLTFTPRKR